MQVFVYTVCRSIKIPIQFNENKSEKGSNAWLLLKLAGVLYVTLSILNLILLQQVNWCV